MIIEQHILSDFSTSDKQNMIMCFGCFDLIHIGHITMLENLKKTDLTLIVCVASDETVQAMKGKQRPIISAEERVAMLDAVKYVDYVFIAKSGNIAPLKKKYNFSDREKLIWENCMYPLSLLMPKFAAISSDFTMSPAIKQYFNDENIQIVEMPYFEQQSTSKIVAKILNICR